MTVFEAPRQLIRRPDRAATVPRRPARYVRPRRRIQLWSYNYDPEPTGIAPLAGVWAREMAGRGHEVLVITAHPHYPSPMWGRSFMPYREVRDGIDVLRLPLATKRSSARDRLLQEASYSAWLTAAALRLDTPDVIVATSPSFPALAPTLAFSRTRRVPWILWLQDILPDGATATGVLDESKLVAAARRFERAAYASATRIVVLSETFRTNLRSKGVPPEKRRWIYNPASRPMASAPRSPDAIDPLQVVTMGNIGYSQGLAELASAFQRDRKLAEKGVRFRMLGDGVAADQVRGVIADDRIEITGVVGPDRLSDELRTAAVGVVSQRYGGAEFNVPSKLANFMGAGVPVVASVREDSEVARILRESRGGWVTSSADPSACTAKLADVLDRPDDLLERGAAALAFAQANFTVKTVADQFEALIEEATLHAAPR